MTFAAKWQPTELKFPTLNHRGEKSPADIHSAVGRALSAWEHMESAFVKLFQVFCETESFAACRAYGTLDSSFGRCKMLVAAREAFFARHPDKENHDASKVVLNAYNTALQYRNHIAHGVSVGFRLESGEFSGYFLAPPSYATKKVEKIDPREIYLLGALYLFKASDITYYATRFEEILNESMHIMVTINSKHGILEPSKLHP